MFRRGLAAGLVMFVIGGFVLAETYRGTITKFDKDEMTITLRPAKKGEKGEEKKFKVSKDVKVFKAGAKKGDEATEIKEDAIKTVSTAVEKGLKAEKGPKGAGASIETEGSGENETVSLGIGSEMVRIRTFWATSGFSAAMVRRASRTS